MGFLKFQIFLVRIIPAEHIGAGKLMGGIGYIPSAYFGIIIAPSKVVFVQVIIFV
jgi:hypothetical protein